MKPTTYPLIRKAGDGWERLIIGSLAAGAPRYEAIEWDERAWQARQRQAASGRAGQGRRRGRR